MPGTVEPMSIAVCYAFAEYANPESRTFASAKRIAADLGVSVPTVNRAIAELYEKGWMKVVGKQGRAVIRQIVLERKPITDDMQTPIVHDRPSRPNYQRGKPKPEFMSMVELLCKPQRNADLPGALDCDKLEQFQREEPLPF